MIQNAGLKLTVIKAIWSLKRDNIFSFNSDNTQWAHKVVKTLKPRLIAILDFRFLFVENESWNNIILRRWDNAGDTMLFLRCVLTLHWCRNITLRHLTIIKTYPLCILDNILISCLKLSDTCYPKIILILFQYSPVVYYSTVLWL